MGQTRTDQKAVSAVDRQRQALELRKAGVGFEQIANQLGYRDASGAYRAVKRALRAVIQQPAEEVRDLEVSRLDAMLFAIWQKVRNGDVLAIDRALKIMARRAALLGLDAPAKVNVSVMVQQAVEQFGLTQDEAAMLADDIEAFIAEQKAVAA